MARISLAVTVILLYSSAMLAQHSSGGGGSSSSSGGGGSHASSSGGSSSSSSSGGHGSGGSVSSGGSHSSGASGSHSSGSSTGSVSRGSGTGSGSGSGSFLRPGSELSRSSGMPAFRTESLTLDKETGRQVQQMVKTGKSLEEIRQFVHTKTGVDPDKRPIRIETNEKRTFLSALRHPLRKPPTAVVADLRHRICVNNSCRVCPAGSSANGKGGCAGPRSNLCASGSYWGGNGCQALGQSWRYHSCRYDNVDPSGLRRAQQRMQKTLAERDAACSLDPAGQECSEKNVLYQRAVADYNLQSRWQKTGFQRCLEGSAFGFFDPIN
jgi:hypothetical protein